MAAGGLFFEDLALGQSAAATRMVSEADVVAFAAVSGDANPVHLDADYAATTPFKQRIAHGMLTASFVSALIAGRLPGPGAVYISQSLSFRRPVLFGAEVTTTVSVTALDPAKARATLACQCSVDGKVVLEGEVVMVPRRAPA
jgi:3-hydroxybutyryl-CoA dehydratase